MINIIHLQFAQIFLLGQTPSFNFFVIVHVFKIFHCTCTQLILQRTRLQKITTKSGSILHYVFKAVVFTFIWQKYIHVYLTHVQIYDRANQIFIKCKNINQLFRILSSVGRSCVSLFKFRLLWL